MPDDSLSAPPLAKIEKMDTQPTLDFERAEIYQIVREGAERSLQERFEAFHAQCPEFYRLLVGYAREVKAAGHSRYSIDALFHRIRWHVQIERRSHEPFKVNNTYSSRYARLIMQQEPDLKDFFETRERKQ